MSSRENCLRWGRTGPRGCIAGCGAGTVTPAADEGRIIFGPFIVASGDCVFGLCRGGPKLVGAGTTGGASLGAYLDDMLVVLGRPFVFGGEAVGRPLPASEGRSLLALGGRALLASKGKGG